MAPARGVQQHAQPAERPAVISDRDKETRRQAIGGGDLAANQGDEAAKAHGADPQLVGLLHDFLLELRQHGIGIHVVERAKQLQLGVVIAGGAVAADADADGTGRAAQALGLPHGVQDALAHAFQVAVGAAQMLERAGYGVLGVHVLAPAALQDQPHFDVRFFPLFKVNDGRSGAEIVAAVLAGERIDGIRPQLAALGRFGHGLENLLLHQDLIHGCRRLDFKRQHAGVLADGPFVLTCHVDVLADDGQRLAGLGRGLFGLQRSGHRLAHVRGQIGGSLNNEFQHAFAEEFHGDLRGDKWRQHVAAATLWPAS